MWLAALLKGPDRDDLMIILKFAYSGTADEAGCAGYENFHNDAACLVKRVWSEKQAYAPGHNQANDPAMTRP